MYFLKAKYWEVIVGLRAAQQSPPIFTLCEEIKHEDAIALREMYLSTIVPII